MAILSKALWYMAVPDTLKLPTQERNGHAKVDSSSPEGILVSPALPGLAGQPFAAATHKEKQLR